MSFPLALLTASLLVLVHHSASASSTTRVWAEPGTLRVMPTMAAPSAASGSGVAVALAGNERESFQLAVRRDGTARAGGDQAYKSTAQPQQQEAIPVWVSQPPAASGVSVSWKQVGFVWVESIYANAQGGGKSWWPDVLLPRADGMMQLVPATTCALWFDVAASAAAKAGNYSVTVTLGVSSTRNVTSTIPIRVFAFALPRTLSLKTAINLDQTNLNRTFKFPPTQPTKLHALWMDYARFILNEYRLNPGTIYADPALVTADEAEELVALGMNHFSIVCASPTTAGAKAQVEALRPYVESLRAKNLTNAAVPGFLSVYGFDEAAQSLNQTIRDVFGIFKDAFPEDIGTMTTAHMQTGTDGAAEQNATKIDAWNIDYMTPILDWVVPANMSSCVHDEGLKMWFYTSCEPILPMPNLRLDNTLLDARSLFWLAAAMEVEGFLYWGFNAYAESVASFTPIDLSGGGSSELSRGSSSSSSSSSSGGGGRDSGGSINTTPPPPLFLPPTQWSLATCTVDGPGKCWAAGLEQIQGDGKLMYYSTEGPLGSLRLAAMRDGQEDFELLQIYSQVLGVPSVAQAEAVANFTNPAKSVSAGGGLTHVEDTVAFARRRLEVAAAIEQAMALPCCSKCSDECAVPGRDCTASELEMTGACNCGGAFVPANHSWRGACREMCRMDSFCHQCNYGC